MTYDGITGKQCNEGGYCGYKFPTGSCWGCNYLGYCDFQRPRDSRSQTDLLGHFIPPLTESSCPFCGRKQPCGQTHTICKTE
jgi:hypothetical protein